jgi:serine/threonine protein kinase
MRFFGLFETSSSLWLVTENCAGGDLHARLNQRREVFLQREQQREELGIGISNEPSSKEGAGNIPPWGGLNEDTAAACVASLLGALAHLHKQNVAHRDVKVCLPNKVDAGCLTYSPSSCFFFYIKFPKFLAWFSAWRFSAITLLFLLFSSTSAS